VSTIVAACRLTDSVKSINQTMHVGGIFCYSAKAFDCVNHEILLAKLYFYGTQGVSDSGPI
jgi:hypothetical protein